MAQRILPFGLLLAFILVFAACERGAAPRPLETPAIAPPAASPTPAPFEDQTAPTPAPLAQSLPPANWQPTPVLFDPYLPAGAAADSAEAQLFDQLLAWLTLHPGDYAGFNAVVAAWPPVPLPNNADIPDDRRLYPERYVSWAESVDLNGDGQNEDIIALKLQQPSWAVLTRQETRYTVVYHSKPWLNNSLAEFVSGDDITCDSRPDVAVKVSSQNTLSMGQTLFIGNWDGITWRAVGNVSASGNDPSDYAVWLSDADDNGCPEVMAQTYPVKMQPARLITTTYSLRDGIYQQTAIAYAPSDFAVFQILDANRALARGDLNSALQLAYLAMADPDRGDALSTVPRADAAIYQARLVSYAAAEAMLVHLLRGDSADARALLERLRSGFDRADNPFLPAAQVLWDSYQTSGDVAAACAAMEEAIRLHGDALLLPYASERLEVQDVCPLEEW